MYTKINTTITLRVSLYTSKTNKDGTHPVRIFLTQKGKRKSISTGVSLRPIEWNRKKNEIRKSVPNKALYEKKIQSDYEHKGKPITPEIVIASLDRTLSNGHVKPFFANVIADFKKNEKHSTAHCNRSCMNSLFRFCKNDALTFQEITPGFLSNYENFMRKDGVSIATIALYMRTLKAIVNRAIQAGECEKDNYPFKVYKIANTSYAKKPKHLSEDELILVKSLNEALYDMKTKLALRVFKFIYYAGGINFSDLVRLKQDNFKGDILEYTRQKTSKNIVVQVHPEGMCILKAIQKEDRFMNSEFLFPFLYSNHKTETQIYNRVKKCLRAVNKDLRDLSIQLKLRTVMKTYTARHTVAFMMALKGVHPSKIQQVFRHSDLTTTMRYIGSFSTNEIYDQVNAVL